MDKRICTESGPNVPRCEDAGHYFEIGKTGPKTQTPLYPRTNKNASAGMTLENW